MSGLGVATNAHVYGGATGNSLAVSSSGNAGVQYSYDKVKNIGHYVLRTGVVRRLPDLPASWVMIFAKEGNRGYVWWAGYGTDLPAVGVGQPIAEGHPLTVPCSNTNQISFIPEQDGDEIYVIAGGVGNDIRITPVNDTSIDVVAPTITSTSPVNAATGIARNVTITITASKALDPTTINTTNVTISPLVTTTTAIDSNNSSNIIMLPSANLAAGTTYTITVSTAVKGANGIALAAPFSFSFATAVPAPPPDTTPPTVVSSSPANNATNVNASTSPTITFSEPLSTTFLNGSAIKMLNVTTNQPVAGLSFALSADNKTVTISGVSLAQSTDYQISVIGGSLGVTDLAGNHYATTATIFFSTEAPPAPASTSYNVVGNAYDTIYYIPGNSETSIHVANKSSKIYGKIPIRFQWTMYKYGPSTLPSGHSYLVWQKKIGTNDYSDYKILKTIDNVVDLKTSDTTFTADVSSNTAALDVDDLISVRYEGGDSNTNIKVKISNFDAFDGANTCNNKTTPKSSGLWQYTDYKSADLAMVIDFKA